MFETSFNRSKDCSSFCAVAPPSSDKTIEGHQASAFDEEADLMLCCRARIQHSARANDLLKRNVDFYYPRQSKRYFFSLDACDKNIFMQWWNFSIMLRWNKEEKNQAVRARVVA